MPDYRRYRVPGDCYFFTVNLLQRSENDLLVRQIENLRATVRKVRLEYPFHIDAWVVLPEHMHCIWTLPPGDAGYADRWRAIKSLFSRGLPPRERKSKARFLRGERGIWQRRVWERAIRDEQEYAAHLDYLHFDPVRHGHVRRVRDWPYSTFARLVSLGVYPPDWTGGDVRDLVVPE